GSAEGRRAGRPDRPDGSGRQQGGDGLRHARQVTDDELPAADPKQRQPLRGGADLAPQGTQGDRLGLAVLGGQNPRRLARVSPDQHLFGVIDSRPKQTTVRLMDDPKRKQSRAANIDPGHGQPPPPNGAWDPPVVAWAPQDLGGSRDRDGRVDLDRAAAEA